MAKGKQILTYSTLSIVGLYFLFLGITTAKAFLAPFITAVILSLVMLPISRKMEGNVQRGLSSFISTFLLFLVSLGFMALLSFQVKNFVEDWPKIKETMRPKLEQLKTFVLEHTPLEEKDLSSSGEGGGLMESLSSRSQQAIGFFSSGMGFFGTYLLVFIYVFFMLNYRKRFKAFLLRLFPKEKEEKVRKVIQKSATVTQQYLVGKLMLMGLLAILYSIGLGLSGVNNYILVSIIAALFTLIPYIGNIIGLAMAMAFGYLTSGEIGVLIGVLVTFTVAQFVESYVLQPFVVGDKVDLHPFFVIVVVILGNALWGIIGMILAIPVMAIITIVFLHIKPLHPFGFLFSKKEIEPE